MPRSVCLLASENFGAESFARDAGTLRGDRRWRGIG